jgi:hypothetical protein
MSVEERDPLTGHQTTGHEWNGITELNTRVPRAVWWAIGITHLWALVMWLLLPTWPLVTTYPKARQPRIDKTTIDSTRDSTSPNQRPPAPIALSSTSTRTWARPSVQ